MHSVSPHGSEALGSRCSNPQRREQRVQKDGRQKSVGHFKHVDVDAGQGVENRGASRQPQQSLGNSQTDEETPVDSKEQNVKSRHRQTNSLDANGHQQR